MEAAMGVASTQAAPALDLAGNARERQERRNLRLQECFASPAGHLVEIGDLLVETRNDLPRGQFLPWLAAAFPACGLATAFDYVMVSETLADFPPSISVSAEALLALARTSTPEELRHYVMRKVGRDESR